MWQIVGRELHPKPAGGAPYHCWFSAPSIQPSSPSLSSSPIPLQSAFSDLLDSIEFRELAQSSHYFVEKCRNWSFQHRCSVVIVLRHLRSEKLPYPSQSSYKVAFSLSPTKNNLNLLPLIRQSFHQQTYSASSHPNEVQRLFIYSRTIWIGNQPQFTLPLPWAVRRSTSSFRKPKSHGLLLRISAIPHDQHSFLSPFHPTSTFFFNHSQLDISLSFLSHFGKSLFLILLARALLDLWCKTTPGASIACHQAKPVPSNQTFLDLSIDHHYPHKSTKNWIRHHHQIIRNDWIRKLPPLSEMHLPSLPDEPSQLRKHDAISFLLSTKSKACMNKSLSCLGHHHTLSCISWAVFCYMLVVVQSQVHHIKIPKHLRNNSLHICTSSETSFEFAIALNMTLENMSRCPQ